MSTYGNDLVREARKRAGLTQRELAEKAGTTQSALARLESGRTKPTLETVMRLIRLCNLDLHFDLVDYDDADWSQAQRLLKLTPAERLDQLQHISDFVDEARRSLSRSVHGAA